MIRSLLAMTALLSLWVAPAFAVQFDHTAHLSYIEDSPCTTCHVAGAEAIKPEDKACLECHEADFVDQVTFLGLATHGPTWSLEHRGAAKGNSTDCAACHEQNFCLECHTDAGRADEMGDLGNAMMNVHRSDFHITHPIAARTDPQLCASCHENKFCTECHDQFAPGDLAVLSHRRGFTDGTLGGAHAGFNETQCQTCHPNSVLPAHTWSTQHAREARKNLATCQACHPQGDVCLKCHSGKSGLGVNPHPKDWDDIKSRLDSASDGRTCRKCH
jgi:hypothetical protein